MATSTAAGGRARSSPRPASAAPAGQRTRGVWLVGAFFALWVLLLADVSRPLRFDEIVYLSQLAVGEPAIDFGPQRARGMTALLAPVAVWSAPVEVIRVWLALVHGVGLALAFRPWAHAAGQRLAVVAAGVVAVSWVPVYFGLEGYPNLATALAGVAAVGYLLRWARGGDDERVGPVARWVVGSGWLERLGTAGRVVAGLSPSLLAAALALAVMATLRPTDAAFLGVTVAVVALVWLRAAALGAVVVLGVGGLVGLVPWLLEGWVRFGGPLARLGAGAAESVGSAARNNLVQYLNLLEGPVRLVVADPVLSYRGLALLVVVGVLFVLGLLGRRHRERWAAAWLAAAAGIGLLVPYLVLPSGINLRYLLPAALLLAVPVAGGLLVLAEAPVPWVRVGAVALVAVFVVWQAVLVRLNVADVIPQQSVGAALGDVLNEHAGDDPCAFAAELSWPEAQWASDCLGERLWLEGPTLQCPDATRDLAALAAEGYRVFALGREPPAGSPLHDWPSESIADRVPGGGTWTLWQRPAELGPADPPTPADPGDAPAVCPPSVAPDTDGASLRLGPSSTRP